MAESYNNVFAAVNLLRGTAVNAKILHVVINAGLVGHEASHQLKYDPGGEFSNWQNKNSGSKNIAEYLLRPALLGGSKFLTESAEHCYKILAPHNFSRGKIFGRRLFNYFSLSSQKNGGQIFLDGV